MCAQYEIGQQLAYDQDQNSVFYCTNLQVDFRMTAVQQLKAPAYEGVINRIPANANSCKLSVKFKDNIYTYQSDG